MPCLQCVAAQADIPVREVRPGDLDLLSDLQPRLRQHIPRKHNDLPPSEKQFLRLRARRLLCHRLHKTQEKFEPDPGHFDLKSTVGLGGYVSKLIHLSALSSVCLCFIFHLSPSLFRFSLVSIFISFFICLNLDFIFQLFPFLISFLSSAIILFIFLLSSLFRDR